MNHKNSAWLGRLPVAMGSLVIATQVLVSIAAGQNRPAKPDPITTPAEEATFQEFVQPLLHKYCQRCHTSDNMKSGVRVDQLSATAEDRHIPLWKAIQKQVADEAMPPADEQPQLTASQRQALTAWITRAIATARTRHTQKNGSVRRLTVAQYRNTLRDLLGLAEDLTDALPPDGISKDGFANNAQTLLLSPLQVETYFDIAEQALERCIVDESAKPVIQTFRVELGASINSNPCPDNLILGANNFLLKNPDFVVTEPRPVKPFDYQPFSMRTKYEFIEGYAGNDTVRGWRKFDSIYHSVFACLRGTPGYPKGEAHQVVAQGLLLRPAIPSPEIFGQSNTYGPMANFKISLRELPDEGNFRVTVKAARYDDALLLDAGAPLAATADGLVATAADWSTSPATTLAIKDAGVYQVDVACAPGQPQGLLTLTLGDRSFGGQLLEAKPRPANPATDDGANDQSTAFVLVKLSAGELKLTARYGNNARLRRLVFSRLPDDSELARRFAVFARRSPSLGVYLGLRRDCGSTLTQVAEPLAVSTNELREYAFEGAIKDFPSPDVERDNVNYLAGIREIGVRSEFTDGRDMPRMLVRSIEFEGPYYTNWPPATHRNIFIESPHKQDPPAYAREILREFATRAFRRPVPPGELEPILAVWRNSFADKPDFRQSIKDALLVVLTSPQFLFLIEQSRTPEAEDLDSHELASKLSYFLWNAPPDRQLLELAAKNTLRESLDAEIMRLIGDPRFGQFIHEFASQWLSLDKFDVVAVDANRFPKLTRDTKTQLRQEPVRFLRHLIEHNLPAKNLIQSDFILANETVASYYGLGDRVESGFRFDPIKHDSEHLGGVLTQAGILAGLSDGRESNPVKRGAWLARKIVAEPPDDPPPNVPQLPKDDGGKLTLREKLERHRSQKGCVKCHLGIDPWGIPFEVMDAAGVWKKSPGADARSTLPDGTEVQDLDGLRAYLAKDRIDQVAFSFLKHVASYATGRSLTYNELAFLEDEGRKLRASDYRLRDMIVFVVKSDLFLKK